MERKEKSDYGLAILNALENNNPREVIDILSNYIKSKNKTLLSKQTGLHRQTIYLAMSDKSNPTIKTLAKLIHAATQTNKG